MSHKHYAALGVTPADDLSTIRKAYHKLSIENHPDKTLGFSEAERAARAETFKAASCAWEVLEKEHNRLLLREWQSTPHTPRTDQPRARARGYAFSFKRDMPKEFDPAVKKKGPVVKKRNPAVKRKDRGVKRKDPVVEGKVSAAEEKVSAAEVREKAAEKEAPSSEEKPPFPEKASESHPN
ncbi:hypothetical protein CC80DRAFT_489576 [Byssothecium circinans]|uniref:J domain-containing protein n=1 Tax=Byssothecium circinans TaxID=147558 RepID=A0A6A5U6V5_9PLEO|nr:hypothetical protein CC80DRAFT_489576 [Byssothecium circinans]